MTTASVGVECYAPYSEHVLFERLGNGVLLMTINRPDRMNAMTLKMFDDLARVWNVIDDDDETNVVVVTGAGRGFCAGMDVREPDPRPEEVIALHATERTRMAGMLHLEKPVIAAVNGAAVGYGLSLALLSDISVVANDAILLDGHTRVGVVAGDHAALMWPQLCGMAKTKFHMLTNTPVTGAEAERMNLVSLAVPTEEVLDRALAIANDLANGSQQALRWTKRALNIGWITNALPQHELSGALELVGLFGEDYMEARLAFREGRTPKFPSNKVAQS